MERTKEQLVQARDDLLARLAAIRADLRGGLDADSKEQAIQLENLDVLREIARIAEEELGHINQKLADLRKND